MKRERMRWATQVFLTENLEWVLRTVHRVHILQTVQSMNEQVQFVCKDKPQNTFQELLSLYQVATLLNLARRSHVRSQEITSKRDMITVYKQQAGCCMACIPHWDALCINLNGNVHVSSPDIPIVHNPSSGIHSFTISSNLGRIQHLCIHLQL